MITLFGYGATMKAMAAMIKSCNIYDDTFEKESSDEFGNILLPSNRFDPYKSHLEIVSPGIPPHSKLPKAALNLISEYDYFYKNYVPFSIWVSGTNGKTTTTQMLYELFKNDGALKGGNMGIPLASLSTDAKMWILETSSFTLHYTKIAAPDVYLLLPISQDHLSWHGNFENYMTAKLKPLTLMNRYSRVIMPKEYKNYKQCRYHKGSIYFYKDTKDLASIFGIDIAKLRFKGGFLSDAVMALSAYMLINKKIDYEVINAFEIGPHKLEEIRDSKGRLFVNDSKATNINATIGALSSYKDKSIILILGGDAKGISLRSLIQNLDRNTTKILAIGSNKEEIASLCNEYGIYYEKCMNLENAVQMASSLMKNDEICILSPACSSLDEFSSYEERGKLFKKYVNSIK